MAVILVYVNIYFLIPKYILKKKFKRYALYFIVSLGLFYVIRTELIYLFINENVWPESESPQKAYSFNHIIVVVLSGIYEVGLATTIKLTADWIYERTRVEKLEKLQLSSELKYLRTQIQPHFFFNTLNNLYALTLKKSDNAPRMVLKLSEMMQYILYDVKGSKASLLKEINHINNFIDIEQLRFEDNIDVEMDITGNIEDVHVPPLLLLSFVENAFKHGMRENDKLKINMSFEVLNSEYLEFTITNNHNPKAYLDKSAGIGNENAKRRLTLLFSNNFILDSKIEGDNYKLFLKIPVQ
ncbi:histidine kinase [uncultured Algibacter sp.]|uniref:sensor histidine kinase n=1 Tax=uncultured Algibacter sp. TaxID=298659 RepID=UPI0030EEA067|tara:strand:+ start:2406 stop:3299 length:894 start_codon:yes stop_codon:yes gene_type:complete